MTDPKLHDDEVDIDARLVQQLVASQFPQWAAMPITAVASAGTDNALFRIGDGLVARLPKIHWAVDNIAREFDWLTTHGERLPLAVPQPIALGAAGENYPWPWGIYEWLDGINPAAEPSRLDSATATQLAEFVVALHDVGAPDGPATGRGVPLAERDRYVRSALRKLDGIVDVDSAHGLWEFSLELPTWHGPNVWLHGDIKAGNMLARDGVLTAVIDFGCVCVGDPACDLIVAWNMLSGDARTTFRSATGVDDATWLRGRGWALSIALIEIPYYLHTNPVMIREAHHVIAEVLANFRETTTPQ